MWSFVIATTGNSYGPTASCVCERVAERPQTGAAGSTGNHHKSARSTASSFWAESHKGKVARDSQTTHHQAWPQSSGSGRAPSQASLPEMPPRLPYVFSSHQLTRPRCANWPLASLRLPGRGSPHRRLGDDQKGCECLQKPCRAGEWLKSQTIGTWGHGCFPLKSFDDLQEGPSFQP